jgi:hypothetical protein
MPDTTKPIEVSANAGVIDLLTAAGRYIVVIFTVFPALIALFKAGDFMGLVSFMEGNDGAALLAAVIGLGPLIYGLRKTFKRGAQVVQVADDPAVPDRVAKVV